MSPVSHRGDVWAQVLIQDWCTFTVTLPLKIRHIRGILPWDESFNCRQWTWSVARFIPVSRALLCHYVIEESRYGCTFQTGATVCHVSINTRPPFLQLDNIFDNGCTEARLRGSARFWRVCCHCLLNLDHATTIGKHPIGRCVWNPSLSNPSTSRAAASATSSSRAIWSEGHMLDLWQSDQSSLWKTHESPSKR